VARWLGNLHIGLLILALVIAFFLWSVAHGTSDTEIGFDVAVELNGVPETLVVTDQSADAVNIKVTGSRAALRNVSANKLRYQIDVSGAKLGLGDYQINPLRIELPGNATVVSHSPSHLQVQFAKRDRKAVGVKADLKGEVAANHRIAAVIVEPDRVWLAGARHQVLRLSSVATEPIDISGLNETTEREATLFLGGGHVWMEESAPVKVTIVIEPEPPPEPPPAVGERPEEQTS
jgi:YbbR domain-containing protein